MGNETEAQDPVVDPSVTDGEETPNPQADLQAKLDALAEQNQKLNNDMRQVVAYAQYMERAGGVGQPGTKAPPEPEPDVDEDTRKLLAQRDQQWAQSLGSVQDKLDHLTFQNTLLASGYGVDAELLRDVDTLVSTKRRAGVPTFDENGRAIPYSRAAALREVLGDRALRGAISAAPVKTIETLRTQLNIERPGGAPPGRAPANTFNEEQWNALPLEERLKRQAADLDKNGF